MFRRIVPPTIDTAFYYDHDSSIRIPVLHRDESAQSISRSSLRRPGAPASCSRHERSLDTRYSCAASSRVESLISSPPPPWLLLSPSCGSDANTHSEIPDRTALLLARPRPTTSAGTGSLAC